MANTPTTDLVTVSTADTTNAGGTWADNTFSQFDNGNAASFGQDDLLYIHNDLAISQQLATNRTGASSHIGFTATTARDGGTNEVFWFWWNFLYPGALQEYNDNSNVTTPGQNNTGGAAGYFICIGTDSTNYKAFHVGGANFGRNPQGGWQSVACDPTITSFPGFSGGTPGTAAFDTFAFVPNVNTAPGRGQANAVDVIRFGRGSIIYTGGAPAGTFSAMATQNDLNTNRWGIFQAIAGGYLFKGRLSLGTSTSSLLFTDSNVNITIDETRCVRSNFNFIDLLNSGSNITWTNVNFTKVSSAGFDIDLARGDFNISAGTVSWTDCSFTNTGFCTFQGTTNATIESCTFRNTRNVTLSGSTNTTLNNCVFTNTTTSNAIIITSSDIKTQVENITNCQFTSDGTSRAIQLSATVSPSSDLTISLDNIKFSGYSASSPLNTNITGTGTDANAAISITHNGTGTIFFDVLNGGDIPSIQNTGTGNVQIRENVSLNVTGLLGNTEVRVYENPSLFTGGASSTEAAGVETVAAVTQTNTASVYLEYNAATVTAINSVGGGADLSTIDLVDGDTLRVTVRDNSDNPTLQVFDEFTVNGTPTATSIPVDSTTGTSFAGVLVGSNTKEVTVEKVNASETFSVASGTYDVFVYRIGSLPIITKALSVTSNTNLPISQAGDRVYKNPA